MANKKLVDLLLQDENANVANEEFETLGGSDWVRLLSKKPQFADKCDCCKISNALIEGTTVSYWHKLTAKQWCDLLIKQLQFIDKCDWSKMHRGYFEQIFNKYPDKMVKLEISQLHTELAACVLESHPELAVKYDRWDEFDSDAWSSLLSKQPQFADKCNWDKLEGWDWNLLLQKQPQFSDKCNWGKLDGSSWSWLLQEQPQFFDKCAWSKLDGWNWRLLLEKQPQFSDKCDWSKLKGSAWCWLLRSQPQFFDKCDWNLLSGNDWGMLLDLRPDFADKCDKWGEFDRLQKKSLLTKHPQLAKYFQKEEKMGNKILTIKQDDSSIVVCIDGKLNFSHSYCFYKDKKDADNESIDFLRHVIETLPPDKGKMLITDGIEVDIKDNELCSTIEKELGLKLYNIYGSSGNSSEFEDDESEEIGEKISAEEYDEIRQQMSDNLDYWKIFCHERGFENISTALYSLFNDITDLDIPLLIDAMGLHSNGIIFDYAYLFNKHPEYIQKCNWNMLNGREWQSLLLCGYPEFSDKCDWSKLEACDWSELLADHPQFADECDKWNDFDDMDWWYLLDAQPQLADKCDWSKLDSLDTYHWSELLQDQPQFADKCNKWAEFDDDEKEALLDAQPQLAKYFSEGNN